MATPVSQQIVRDTFTRANAGTLGANWTSLSDATDTGTLGITSNTASPQTNNARSASFWNANTFAANQYSQVIVSASATGTNNHLVGPTVRSSAGNYYGFTWNALSPTSFALFKVVAGAYTDLGGPPSTGTAASGSLLRLEVVGTQLSAYCDGVLVFQLTDSSLASGSPGVTGYRLLAAPTATMTTWEGGNIIWTRKGTVIPIGSSGGTQEPSVIYEANPHILTANGDGKIWKMWHTNGWTTASINYAESNDGIIWTEYGSNPVISDGANVLAHGYVMKNGSTYYGFFCTDASSATNMNRWTSSDGLTWTKANLNILSLGGGGAWDSAGLFNPYVWVQAGTWYMLYTGRLSVIYSIGLATSSDGVTWTKYASNPVITSGSFTNQNNKNVIIDGSTYYLWGCTTPSSNLPTDITLWSSTDLHTWTPATKNPVYERVLANEGANLSVGQIADSAMVELNGTTYSYFDATDAQASGHIHINLATAPYTLLQLVAMVFGAFIIYGTAAPNVIVSYTGPESGSVTADSAGNYTIPVSTNGTYTITPTGSFKPASQSAVVTSADASGVNFTQVLGGRIGNFAVGPSLIGSGDAQTYLGN